MRMGTSLLLLAFTALVGGSFAAEADGLGAALEEGGLINRLHFFDTAVLPNEAFARPSGPVPSAPCNQTLFTSCIHQYNAALGVGSKPPANAQAFIALLQAIVANQGRRGLQKICTADTFLYNCLGAIQTGACLNPLYLLSIGDSPADAYTYASIRATLHFECGGGLMPILYNYNCMMATQQAMNTTIQNCAADFGRNLRNDYAHACGYLQTYANCVGKVFAHCNAASAWTTCETSRVGATAANLYQCSSAVTCNVATLSSSTDGEVERGTGGEGEVERLAAQAPEVATLITQDRHKP